MFIYSSTINEPIYFRIVPGNVREVKAFELSIVESGIEDAILIADKGFYSTKNINDLDKSKLKYILPLRRNSSLVDYNPILQNSKKGMQSYLKFEDRYVWYYTNKTKNKNIICFLDDKLKVEEEADYLDRIASQPENYSFVEFESKMKTFGTIAMITNLVDYNPKDIYLAYKSRQKIEQMIDIMKNVVESDRTYMQDDDALQGWFFVNYISLLFYFRIYKFLVNENMLSKISPNDLLIYLSEIKKIKINNQWLLSEINSKISNILKKLNINIT